MLIPTLDELLNPESQDPAVREALSSADELDPIRLFDITWKREGGVPHVVVPPEVSGVDATIVVISGRKFPTGSHKVGPAYSCAREKLVSGEITQDGSTLVFPSTGNYGIGGAWVGPRLGFRSLVVLPEEMSAERFEKIRGYGAEVIATPGSESNVKEIYDEVRRLRANPNNRILNQFDEMGNYRFHHHVTGNSIQALLDDLGLDRCDAFVSAMGSSGTIAAGDRLKQLHGGCAIVGLEPVQCPTLYNVGFGAHAIEGIGDKHVTWVHNVRNMDLLFCIDDQACLEGLQLLQEGLHHVGIDWDVDGVFGVSGLCNLIGAIKTARHLELGAGKVIVTVATDGFDRYPSVLRRLESNCGPQTAEVAKRRLDALRNTRADHALDGTMAVRKRWHNQKYFTWVEQQGRSVDELNRLWDQGYWDEQAAMVPDIDARTVQWRLG
jgi:cysteine synthase